MYISYSSSDSYAGYTGISMCSLLVNNRQDIEEIFLLNNNISEGNIKKFEQISQKYNVKIHILDVSDILDKYALENPIPKFAGSYSTYSRLIPEKIYPDYVKKILVIDSDTIVDRPLSDFPWEEMESHVVGAINHPEAHYFPQFFSENEIMNLRNKKFYLNCGIIAYNIEKWIEYKVPERIKHSIQEIESFRNADQTIMNYTLNKEEIHFIDLKYNSFFHQIPKYLLETYKRAYESIDGCNNLAEAINSPIIIHYKGQLMRPWYKYSFSNAQDRFFFYKKISPWKDMPIEDNKYSKYGVIKFRIKKLIRNTPLALLKKGKIERGFNKDKVI